MVKLKKAISCILLIAMLCSIGSFSAFALTADSFAVTNATVTASATEDQTVSINIHGTKDQSYGYVVGVFDTTVSGTQITIKEMTPNYTLDADLTNNYVFKDYGAFKAFSASGISFAKDAPIVTVEYTIPAGTAPGTYNVNVTVEDAIESAEPRVRLQNQKYTATITVEEPDEPEAPKADYELYYELNSDVDVLNSDNYMEYAAGDTVNADIYLVNNNIDDSIALQAFDVYLTYSDKLMFAGYEGSGLAKKQTADADASMGESDPSNAQPGDKVTHIQMVAGTATDLTKGTAVKLGTISFTFAADAAYDENLGIALTDGTSVISVGMAGTGDKTAYYPTVTATDLGAEINTTYKVTYQPGVNDGSVTNMPDPTEYTVGYNVAFTAAAAPGRTGYDFAGWKDADSADYTVGNAYTPNKDVTLTAQWTQKTYTITWHDENGSVLETTTVAHGTAPTYTAPDKPADAQYTYTFAGWKAEDDTVYTGTLPQATANASYTATYASTMNTYTVTFVDKDGSELKTIEKVVYGSAVVEAEKPTYAPVGYSVTGWYTDSALTSEYIFGTTTITAATTLYPKLEAKTVTVTFNAQDGSVSPATSVVTFGKTYGEGTNLTDSKLPTPKKTGYTFNGWFTEVNGGGTQVTAEMQVTLDGGTQTLYASWTAKTYTVNFAANATTGVTGSMDPQTFTYGGTNVLDANAFSREGYAFSGWAKEGNKDVVVYGNGATVGDELYNEDGTVVTLYAVWEAGSYEITYKSDMNGMDTTGLATTYQVSETEQTITAEPTLSGYTFAGWTATDSSITSSDAAFTIPAGYAKNIELTASWTPNTYIVTYNANNGTCDTASAQKTFGVAYGTLPEATRDGYDFDGWYLGDTKITAESILNTADDHTLVAKWIAKIYTVTFNANGGSVNPESSVVTFDKTYGDGTNLTDSKLPTPSKTGYDFGGWYLESDTSFATAIIGTTTVATASDHILVAKWTAQTATVTLDPAPGTFAEGVANTIQVTFGEAYGDLPTPTLEGYDFSGWTLDGNPVEKDTTVETAGAHTLVASWSIKKFIVTFMDGATELADLKKSDVEWNTAISEVTAPAKNGYNFDAWYKEEDFQTKWNFSEDVVTDNVVLYAKYDAISYTIKFYDGTTELTNLEMNYTIENPVVLPTYTKDNYNFKYWRLEADSDGWSAGDYNAGDDNSQTGMYGDISLTAVWELAISIDIQEYKYANTNYKMILVKGNIGDTEIFTYDGVDMFYIDDENYKTTEGEQGVFVALVAESDKDAIAAKIGTKTAERKSPVYNGDINGDSAINIADANIVYQMVLNGGGYYTNLDDAQRLGADMDKTIGTGTEHRGTIADVNAIVDIINGTTGG